MARPIRIQTPAEVADLRRRLDESERRALVVLAELATHPNALEKLKFERLGYDPIEADRRENLLEQVNQQATYEAAYSALVVLMERHPHKTWVFAPGSHGDGHDIEADDGSVAAEVFAAVHPKNNRKLSSDIAKLEKSVGVEHRYVFFRSPATEAHEERRDDVLVVALPPRMSRP